MEEEITMLNWRQVCAMLGCSRSFFYTLVNSGSLPAVRFGDVKGRSCA